MNRSKVLTSVSLVLALTLVSFAWGEEKVGAKNDKSASAPASQPAAVDLKNTVCPVTMDKVGDSKLTETYEGKIYHFCCDGCPADFKKDPAKYAKAIAADPVKYGVEKSK